MYVSHRSILRLAPSVAFGGCTACALKRREGTSVRGGFLVAVVVRMRMEYAGNSSKNCNVRRKQSEAAAALAAGGRIRLIK